MVFEITCPQFSGAVAGGGRYDNMIGKFLGTKVPAVGFSIGFERVCGILLEQGYQIPGAKQKIALLYNSDVDFPAVLAKPHSCATPTMSPFCLRPRSWASSWASWSFRFRRCRLYGQGRGKDLRTAVMGGRGKLSRASEYGLRLPASASCACTRILLARGPQQQLPVSATGGGRCCCRPFHYPSGHLLWETSRRPLQQHI